MTNPSEPLREGKIGPFEQLSAEDMLELASDVRELIDSIPESELRHIEMHRLQTLTPMLLNFAGFPEEARTTADELTRDDFRAKQRAYTHLFGIGDEESLKLARQAMSQGSNQLGTPDFVAEHLIGTPTAEQLAELVLGGDLELAPLAISAAEGCYDPSDKVTFLSYIFGGGVDTALALAEKALTSNDFAEELKQHFTVRLIDACVKRGKLEDAVRLADSTVLTPVQRATSFVEIYLAGLESVLPKALASIQEAEAWRTMPEITLLQARLLAHGHQELREDVELRMPLIDDREGFYMTAVYAQLIKSGDQDALEQVLGIIGQISDPSAQIRSLGQLLDEGIDVVEQYRKVAETTDNTNIDELSRLLDFDISLFSRAMERMRAIPPDQKIKKLATLEAIVVATIRHLSRERKKKS